MRARLEWEPRDCWIGVFWRRSSFGLQGFGFVDVWICIVPMVPIHIWWKR